MRREVPADRIPEVVAVEIAGVVEAAEMIVTATGHNRGPGQAQVGSAGSSCFFLGNQRTPPRQLATSFRACSKAMGLHDLFFRMLGVQVGVNCPVPELQALVRAHWGHMADGEARADVMYTVARNNRNAAISIARPGQPTKWTSDEAEFLYELEGDLNIALQRCRQDLYFMHAAVAEVGGRACLLVAESGGGKSTTLWGLLHHGWSYMSDELAPIDLSSMQVHAYPRALCLKHRPPAAYPLPAETVETQRTFHVPVKHLPRVSQMETYPLTSVYFVTYCPTAVTPAIRAISPGEAGARLYANALNPLAHANAGLDAAVRIAKNIPSFALDTVDLALTCAAVAAHVS